MSRKITLDWNVYLDTARKTVAEGCVLLKNDNKALPFEKDCRISVFGRIQKHYYKSGTGSGGMVNVTKVTNIMDGLRESGAVRINEKLVAVYDEWEKTHPYDAGTGWGNENWSQEEMPLDDSVVSEAAAGSDAAVIVIGRTAGEDRDSSCTGGSFLLTDIEEQMLEKVCKAFKRVVVLLNVGGIIDMSFVEKYDPAAVMYVWQGGMTGGSGIADVLTGAASPSGKLTDTIARSISDYPAHDNFGGDERNFYCEDIYVGYRYFETFAKDKVLYPFGYGLSYTDFDIDLIKSDADENGFSFTVNVKNTGERSGKKAVQLYISKPCGKLGNASRELVAFKKTKELNPNESEELTLYVDAYQLTSYDDCGATNNANAYVTQAGEYTFFLGENVRDAKEIYSYYQEETALFEQLKQVCAPKFDFTIMKADEIDGKIVLSQKPVAKEKYDLATRILNNLPQEIEQTGDRGIKLGDVKSGKATMDEFIAQLSNDELEALTRGGYKMNNPLGPKGNAGIYGGVLESLREKGVRPIVTTDGPSGIRLVHCSSLLPIGALMACSFNTELVSSIYKIIAKEMKERGSDVLLAPGMNIHRNPLCGRNFEYFSEDPYLSGKMGGACVEGIQSEGGSACPKHFACNNQELCRNTNDSCLSERALREIYLKGFEICINDSKPKNIMTSYNKINGVWCHYNYDTCVTVLRKEWGYEGNVMTDWWMKPSKSIEFPKLKNQAYRVRSGVNLLMPGGERVTNEKPDGTLLATLSKRDGITLGEIQESAKRVLQSVIDID